MAEKKEKQYVSDNAQLMAEWNWEKNNELGLYPKKLTFGSGKKVWWKCYKGHEWQAVIYNRNKGIDCPYCSNQKILKGYNDLGTLNPVLAKEWNYEKNGDLKPEYVSVGSNKKVWWKCNKGHEWIAIINHRNNGHSCPYCSNQKILKGYNDLGTLNPALAKEWNHERNGDLKPEDVTVGSNKKVWWKCKKGHEWQSIINNRHKGIGCPVCNAERNTSFPEYVFLYYLKQCGLEVEHGYKGKGYELDIYIPSKKSLLNMMGIFIIKVKQKKI